MAGLPALPDCQACPIAGFKFGCQIARPAQFAGFKLGCQIARPARLPGSSLDARLPGLPDCQVQAFVRWIAKVPDHQSVPAGPHLLHDQRGPCTNRQSIIQMKCIISVVVVDELTGPRTCMECKFKRSFRAHDLDLLFL